MAIRSHQTGLAVITVFKVVKGLLLLLVGLDLLRRDSLRKDVTSRS